MSERFYVTTPIYYMNGAPHIGHTYTTCIADTLTRYHRLRGEDVFFLTGSDEHGEKIFETADREGCTPQQLTDRYAALFRETWAQHEIQFDRFIRTTDEDHVRAVQHFLQRVHGMSQAEAGFWLGPVSGIGSFSAGLFWGYAVDMWGKRDLRWYMWLPTAATLVAMPFSYAFVLWPDQNAVWFLPVAAFFGNCYAGATFAMVQGLAKPHMRAMAAAGVLFVMNLGGLGLGPTVIGLMNDWLEPRFGLEAIRVSLLIIGLPHILAAVFGIWAARTLREDVAAARR